jgi:hypothetical protein
MSNNFIIFEDINQEYAWANYLGIKVMIMKSVGYVNVTKMCNEYSKKDFFHWKENKKSQELLKYYTDKFKTNDIPVLIINATETGIKYRGTYAHPKLVLNIACWISNDFYDKVSDIITEYNNNNQERERLEAEHKKSLNKIESDWTVKYDALNTEKVHIQVEKCKVDLLREELQKKFAISDKMVNDIKKELEESKESRQRIEVLLKETKSICKQTRDRVGILEEKLDEVSDVVVPKTKHQGYQESFCLLKNCRDDYDPDDEYEYYAVCGQIKYVKGIKAKRMKEGFKEVLHIECTPNTKNILHRIKEKLSHNISYSDNKLDRKNITEKQLLKKINDINQEKVEACII